MSPLATSYFTFIAHSLLGKNCGVSYTNVASLQCYLVSITRSQLLCVISIKFVNDDYVCLVVVYQQKFVNLADHKAWGKLNARIIKKFRKKVNSLQNTIIYQPLKSNVVIVFYIS